MLQSVGSQRVGHDWATTKERRKADQTQTLPEAWADSETPFLGFIVPPPTFSSYWQGQWGPRLEVGDGFQLRSDGCCEINNKMTSQKAFMLLIKQTCREPHKSNSYIISCVYNNCFLQKLCWIRPKLIQFTIIKQWVFLKGKCKFWVLRHYVLFVRIFLQSLQWQKKINTGLWTMDKFFFFCIYIPLEPG